MVHVGSSTRAFRQEQMRWTLGKLRWSIDEQHGPVIGLHFPGDRVTPQRTVYVYHEDGRDAVTFAVASRTEFSEYDLLPDMLSRNDILGLGAWSAKEVQGMVTLVFQYTALTAGVDPDNFKLICHAVLKEVAEMEAVFESKGLLKPLRIPARESRCSDAEVST
jgi:hypothetical protein